MGSNEPRKLFVLAFDPSYATWGDVGCCSLFLVTCQKYIKIISPETILHIPFIERIKNCAIKLILCLERDYYLPHLMEIVSLLCKWCFNCFSVYSYTLWYSSKGFKKLAKKAYWWNAKDTNTLLSHDCLWSNNSKLTFRCHLIINYKSICVMWQVRGTINWILMTTSDLWLELEDQHSMIGTNQYQNVLSFCSCSVSNSQKIS